MRRTCHWTAGSLLPRKGKTYYYLFFILILDSFFFQTPSRRVSTAHENATAFQAQHRENASRTTHSIPGSGNGPPPRPGCCEASRRTRRAPVERLAVAAAAAAASAEEAFGQCAAYLFPLSGARIMFSFSDSLSLSLITADHLLERIRPPHCQSLADGRLHLPAGLLRLGEAGARRNPLCAARYVCPFSARRPLSSFLSQLILQRRWMPLRLRSRTYRTPRRPPRRPPPGHRERL